MLEGSQEFLLRVSFWAGFSSGIGMGRSQLARSGFLEGQHLLFERPEVRLDSIAGQLLTSGSPRPRAGFPNPMDYSISSAMPARCNTNPSACFVAPRCRQMRGLKLSFPKRKGNKS